jgi:hypothetical protein
MNMLQANNPYHRVDDGIGAGLVTGALLGGGSVAAANYLLPRFSPSATASSGPGGSVTVSPAVMSRMSESEKAAMGIQETRQGSNWASKAHSALFGGDKVGWGKFKMGRKSAITAGAGVLAGALLGGAIDGLTD